MRWFNMLLALVFLMFLALWLLRPMGTSLVSQPKGPIIAARITWMEPGHRRMAHTMRITVTDGAGRVGGFNVPGRLNTCRVGDMIAARRIGVRLAVEPGQCRRPE